MCILDYAVNFFLRALAARHEIGQQDSIGSCVSLSRP
jgi:hypothetical protein